MDREAVRELLVQLRDTIRAEREHAKALDLAAMAQCLPLPCDLALDPGHHGIFWPKNRADHL